MFLAALGYLNRTPVSQPRRDPTPTPPPCHNTAYQQVCSQGLNRGCKSGWLSALRNPLPSALTMFQETLSFGRLNCSMVAVSARSRLASICLCLEALSPPLQTPRCSLSGSHRGVSLFCQPVFVLLLLQVLPRLCRPLSTLLIPEKAPQALF